MTLDECAKILVDGLTLQVKRGLVKDYVQGVDTETAIKGRMDVSASLRDRTIYKRQMVCIYEEYTENCPLNRIVKAGALLLISCPDISDENRKKLQDLMIYFKISASGEWTGGSITARTALPTDLWLKPFISPPGSFYEKNKKKAAFCGLSTGNAAGVHCSFFTFNAHTCQCGRAAWRNGF